MNNLLFNNIDFTFIHKGNMINGNLNGDVKYWEFSSNNAFFLTYFPSGKITPRISFNRNFVEMDAILNDFYKVADALLIKESNNEIH